MANLNRVLLIGNLTRDPELRYTPKGTAVVEIGLAVNRIYSGEDGEKKEETTFVDVTLWARQAEIAGQYLKKPVRFSSKAVSNWTPGTISKPVKNVLDCASLAKISNCLAAVRKVKAHHQLRRLVAALPPPPL